MNSAQLNAAQSHAETQGNTNELMDSSKSMMQMDSSKSMMQMDSSMSMMQMDSSMSMMQSGAESGADSAQMRREDQGESGLLQQTGEQMMNMAQGAIDGMKNTLGMGDQKK